jgi:hypothetical protein
VRACLTVIDHNRNVGRKVLLDHDGNKRYNIVCGRDGITYTPKKLKERKDTSWRTEICDEVLQVRYTHVIFISGFRIRIRMEAYG